MIEPIQIIEESKDRLSIKWSDESETTYSAADLRRMCPCAGCIDEWTGEKRLDDSNIAHDIHITHTSIVGRYALNFHFSDEHDTGIYSFAYLRKIAGSNDDTQPL